MSEIIKVNHSALSAIHDTELLTYTEMLVSDLANVRYYMIRASVVLAAIDESKCYERDGFATIHEYTEAILGIKRAQSYAILKVGKTLVNTETMESLLPHETDNDYSMSQLQALLPLKSVETAQDMALTGEISPDMTVNEIKVRVKAHIRNESDEGGEADDSEVVVENVSVEDTDNGAQSGPVVADDVEHVIIIGHKSDGTPWARVDDEFVPYEVCYEIVASGMRFIA